MPTQLFPNTQSGSARINGTLGAFANPPTGMITSVLRTGTGVYELTIDPGASITEHSMFTQVLSSLAADFGINVDYVSNALIRIRTLTISGGAVAAADLDFFVDLKRYRTAN